MSWNWENVMNKEMASDYEIKGTVTISTVEYRDLLNRISELRLAGQKEHDDWHVMYTERDKYKKQVDECKEQIEKLNGEIKTYKDFIANKDLALKFFNYKEELGEDEDND